MELGKTCMVGQEISRPLGMTTCFVYSYYIFWFSYCLYIFSHFISSLGIISLCYLFLLSLSCLYVLFLVLQDIPVQHVSRWYPWDLFRWVHISSFLPQHHKARCVPWCRTGRGRGPSQVLTTFHAELGENMSGQRLRPFQVLTMFPAEQGENVVYGWRLGPSMYMRTGAQFGQEICGNSSVRCCLKVASHLQLKWSVSLSSWDVPIRLDWPCKSGGWMNSLPGCNNFSHGTIRTLWNLV